MTYEFWHDFAGPLATVIASIVAVVVTIHLGRTQAQIAREQARIASQQAELAAVRLRHDLYDRRFPIFAAARELLFDIESEGKISGERLSKFLQQKAYAVFLLNDNITEYFEEFSNKVFKLMRTKSRLREATNESGIESLADEEAELTLWFAAQYKILVAKFRPFLALDQAQS